MAGDLKSTLDITMGFSRSMCYPSKCKVSTFVQRCNLMLNGFGGILLFEVDTFVSISPCSLFGSLGALKLVSHFLQLCHQILLFHIAKSRFPSFSRLPTICYLVFAIWLLRRRHDIYYLYLICHVLYGHVLYVLCGHAIPIISQTSCPENVTADSNCLGILFYVI